MVLLDFRSLFGFLVDLHTIDVQPSDLHSVVSGLGLIALLIVSISAGAVAMVLVVVGMRSSIR